MNKKGFFGGGMGMSSPRKMISFLLGFVCVIFGGIPLLFQMKVIGFTLPVLPNLLLWILGLAGGLFLIIDGYQERMSFGLGKSLMWISILVGIVMFLFGLIPILFAMGVVSFTLPAFAVLTIEVLFTLAGFLLFAGGFIGF